MQLLTVVLMKKAFCHRLMQCNAQNIMQYAKCGIFAAFYGFRLPALAAGVRCCLRSLKYVTVM